MSTSTQVQGSAAENERQGISVTANTGSFVLAFDPDGAGPDPAQETADIPIGSDGPTVQAALVALARDWRRRRECQRECHR